MGHVDGTAMRVVASELPQRILHNLLCPLVSGILPPPPTEIVNSTN